MMRAIAESADDRFDDRPLSARLRNENLPFNGIMHNGDHITQSMAFYEALAIEDFARNAERDRAQAIKIREIYSQGLTKPIA